MLVELVTFTQTSGKGESAIKFTHHHGLCWIKQEKLVIFQNKQDLHKSALNMETKQIPVNGIQYMGMM